MLFILQLWNTINFLYRSVIFKQIDNLLIYNYQRIYLQHNTIVCNILQAEVLNNLIQAWM